MSIVVTYLAYLLISIGLAVVTGTVLARSGRLFLAEALGGDASAGNDRAANDRAAKGITSLIVVTFYLISLGFIVLTMRISSDSVSAIQAIRLLATKVGVVLLFLGGLYLAGIIALTRLRRRFKAQGQPADLTVASDLTVGGTPTASVPRAAPWHPSASRLAR